MAIISLYLKLNIILMAAFVGWIIVRKTAQTLNISLSHQYELSLARIYFLLVLVLPLLISMLNLSFLTQAEIPGLMVVGQSVSTRIDSSLSTQFIIAGQSFNLLLCVVSLLAIGISAQFINTYKKYQQLSKLLANSVQWKKIHGINISFSQEITTPFSTGILGQYQIILPYLLLESPQNFRLAVKHELQHIRNTDLRWVLMLDFIKPVFFWNPAFYAWHNELHCLQEYACDEALITKSNVNTMVYGRCLVDLASHALSRPLFASSNMVPNFSLFKGSQSQLKKRILMMKQTPNNKFEKLKLSLYSAFLILVLTGCSINALQTAETNHPEMFPITTVQPKYPQEALTQGIEGWVLLEFTVNTQGNVINPFVLDSCRDAEMPSRDGAVEECTNSEIFNSTTLAAIEQFKFEPRMINGDYADIPGVKYLFYFDLQE